jgi:hypothetical protein
MPPEHVLHEPIYLNEGMDLRILQNGTYEIDGDSEKECGNPIYQRNIAFFVGGLIIVLNPSSSFSFFRADGR